MKGSIPSFRSISEIAQLVERLTVNQKVVGSWPTLRASTGWQSGDAGDCKSPYAGSTPAPVSAEVVQWVERQFEALRVGGSIPSLCAIASSSRGRTPEFDSGNRGSNPRLATMQV
jgi:hypothetical protein